MKYNKNEIQKILILKNDKIGDMVVSSRAIKEIREAFPKAEITIIASPSNKRLIEKSPFVNKILLLNYHLTNYKEFKDYLKMALKLRREHFDLGIDLRGSFYNIFFLLFLAGVKKRVGLYHRDFSKIFLHDGIKKERYVGKHCVPLRKELLEKTLGIKMKDYWPFIYTTKEDESQFKNFIKNNKIKRYVTIIPDASYELKQWPLENWDTVIKHLKKNYPKYSIVMTGGDMNKIGWLKEKNPYAAIPPPEVNDNLRAVYHLLKNSDLVISQDGGLMHLAWASKAPVIALMADHLPIEYLKPLGKKSITVSGKIKSLPVEEVTKNIPKLIQG